MAGRLGLEPRFTDPESAVLPLDDLPIRKRSDFSITCPCSTSTESLKYLRMSGKHYLVGALLLLLFLGLAVGVGLKKERTDFIAPIPLGVFDEEAPDSQVKAAMAESGSVYRPDISEIYHNPSVSLEYPEIDGTSALVIDTTNDKVLYSLNPHSRQSVASVIKIMTAVVALDHASPEKVIVVSERAARVGEDTMALEAGEKYTLKELLYGLLLPSANDAAEAIAEGVGGDRETFITWMNEKAEYLGLTDTRCADPSGLSDPGDENQYSTAYDLVVLTYYALHKYPLLEEIVSTEEFELAESPNHKYVYLWNMTNLLGIYPGVYGVKPGYNDYSGFCLVTACRRGSHDLLAVVLNSNDRRGDMRLLLDYSLAQLNVPPAE